MLVLTPVKPPIIPADIDPLEDQATLQDNGNSASKTSKKVISALAIGALATVAAIYLCLQNANIKEPLVSKALVKYQAPTIQPKCFFIKGNHDVAHDMTPTNVGRSLILRDKIAQDVILAQPVFSNEIISTTHHAEMCNLSSSNLLALPLPLALNPSIRKNLLVQTAPAVIESNLFSNHSSTSPTYAPQHTFSNEDLLAQGQCAAPAVIELNLVSNHSSTSPAYAPQRTFSNDDSFAQGQCDAPAVIESNLVFNRSSALPTNTPQRPFFNDELFAQTPCDPTAVIVNNAVKDNFFNKNQKYFNFTYASKEQCKA